MRHQQQIKPVVIQEEQKQLETVEEGLFETDDLQVREEINREIEVHSWRL